MPFVRSPNNRRSFTDSFALSFLAGTLLCCFSLAGCGSQSPEAHSGTQRVRGANAALSPAAQSLTDFGLRLYAQSKPRTGNYTLSPVSLASALALAANGAAGTTQEEMAHVLSTSVDRLGPLSEELGLWSRNLSEGPATVRSANRIYVDASYSLRADYLERMQSSFASPLHQVDFRERPNEVRREINQWVNEYTEEKISEILPDGSVRSSTRVVLVNALYFLATWKIPFSESATVRETFHNLNGSENQTWMMQHRPLAARAARYTEDGEMQALEIGYEGNRYAMLFILPHSFADYEQSLHASKLESVIRALEYRPVNVTLPRFRLESEPVRMNDAFRALGMQRAFEPNQANFQNMTNSNDLFVGEIFHRTYIDVNEQGTEAAAATGMTMELTSARVDPPRIPDFRADRPFLFVLRDLQSGFPLFVGRVISL